MKIKTKIKAGFSRGDTDIDSVVDELQGIVVLC
jgi:hypothetical protein